MRRVRRLFWQLRREVQFDLIHQLNPVFTGLSLALAGAGIPVVLGTYVARWPIEQAFGTARSPKGRAMAVVAIWFPRSSNGTPIAWC